MCCLLYEEDFYKEAVKKFPKTGSRVETDSGPGTVDRVDIFDELVYVSYEDGHEEKLHLSEISRGGKPKRRLIPRREKK
jgi:cell fate regulator YaaT (PSP1 superfamily)